MLTFAAFTIDKHNLAAITFSGMILDVVGALYLAYDLLGKKSGFLRSCTRIAIYGSLSGIIGILILVFTGHIVIAVTADIGFWLIFGAYWALIRVMEGPLLPGIDVAAEFERRTRRPTLITLSMFVVVLATLMVAILQMTTSGGFSSPLAWVIAFCFSITFMLVLMFGPFVEWWVDRLPKHRLGVIGAWLIVGGFVVQSLQYLVIMFDIPIK